MSLIPVSLKRSANKEYKRKAGGRHYRKNVLAVQVRFIHYFLQWLRDGFFLQLWRAGLAEYDELEGIAWKWQSIDGAMVKAPLAQGTVGPNPMERGKKWKQEAFAGGRVWHPVIDSHDRSKQA